MTDRILLRGGLVADGVAATTRRADVLIEGTQIAAVRDAPEEGAHWFSSSSWPSARSSKESPAPASNNRAAQNVPE